MPTTPPTTPAGPTPESNAAAIAGLHDEVAALHGEVDELEEDEGGILAFYDALPTSYKVVTLLAAAFVLAVLFGIYHTYYLHWFALHTGILNAGPDKYYNFWSGFGSDLGEATLVIGVFAAWRHHNCHVRGCVRLGREVSGTPYVACPKHHPAHKGTKRGVSMATIHNAHNAFKKAQADSQAALVTAATTPTAPASPAAHVPAGPPPGTLIR